jgi:hypothetical protein
MVSEEEARRIVAMAFNNASKKRVSPPGLCREEIPPPEDGICMIVLASATVHAH